MRGQRALVGTFCLGASVVPLTVGAGAATAVPARPSAGCALPGSVSPGTSNILLAAGGDNGAYVREVPPSYAGHVPTPVVIDLHGYGEPASLQVLLTALGTYGDTHGFITITPQVASPVPDWDPSLGGKDLAFFGGLMRAIDSTLCVDRNRIFVTGYSDGAFMASAIACQFAGQVAAVAPIAGIDDPKGCHPSRPVPMVAFHGTADGFVPYTGGLGPSALKLPAPDGSKKTIGQLVPAGSPLLAGPSVPAATAGWAKRNGCAPAPKLSTVAPDVTLIEYRCPRRADVELYRINGGGHAWPGSVFSKGIQSIVGKVTSSISANQIMWDFFRAHPLRH